MSICVCSLRKRAPLNVIDQNERRKSFKDNRVSLIKLAHATRTFWTQAEALEYIDQRQKNSKNQHHVIKIECICMGHQVIV